MFTRATGGGVELRLSRQERALLGGLVAELRGLLGAAPEDASLRRLFPPAYQNEEDERGYRELMGGELLEGRLAELELVAATAKRKRLTADEAEAWLRALNDLRLVLGTRLDVREDTRFDDLRPDDPRGHGLAVYGYLSWLQEQLVEALSPD